MHIRSADYPPHLKVSLRYLVKHTTFQHMARFWRFEVRITKKRFLCCQLNFKFEAFLRRCKRCGYCSSDLPDFEELLDESDDRLFANILNNTHHVLHKFLPNETDHRYNLRSRRHSLSLTVKTDCNNFLKDYGTF